MSKRSLVAVEKKPTEHAGRDERDAPAAHAFAIEAPGAEAASV